MSTPILPNSFHTLAPFIPRWLRTQLATRPASVTPGSIVARQAAVLFADLSGFTALTDALTRTGAEGVEELDCLLNDVFTALIDSIHAHGGDVVRFGGDALTVLFPVESPGIHRTLDLARRRALACAVAMQQAMTQFQAVQTHAGVFALRLKIGIAAGAVQLQIVGTPELGLDLVVTGTALDNATHLKPQPGQILIQQRAIRIVKIAPPVRAVKWRDPGALSDESLAPFVPAIVRERLRASSTAFLSELRRIAVLFVEFNADKNLQAYVVAAQTLAAQSGGWVNVDVADKGSVLFILFGAPVSLGDEPARALACALALIKHSQTRRIGISSGQVFAGALGSSDRQAYTVLGSEMNLAARLMTCARRGAILASGRIHSELAQQFAFGVEQLIRTKTKSEQVPAFPLIGAIEPTTQKHAPMVGRANELAQIDNAIQNATQGHGSLIGISGEAGIGKSRLAEELGERAAANHLPTQVGHCRVDGQAIAYLPWRGIVRGLAGLAMQADRATILERLTAWLTSINPDLISRLPLLGDVLGIDLPDTDLTRHLDARLRQQSTQALIIDLLHAQGKRAIIIEDAHWADALSLDLTLAVARACADVGLLIALVHRPIQEPKPAVWNALTVLPNAIAITLDELGADETIALVANRLGVVELPQELSDWLLAKSHGRPFFAEELIDALRDTRTLQIQAGRVAISGDLAWVSVPDTVQGVVQARIDRLDEATKLTLKVASVVGRVFRVDTLLSAYPFSLAPNALDDQLSQLEQLDITPLERPAPERAYRFKHPITHEIAYGTLTFAQRRTLHAAIARWYESSFLTNFDSVLPLIAYHWARSNEFEPAVRYSLAAADQAKTRYANQAALQLFDQVFEVLARSEQPANDPATTAPISPSARAQFETTARLGQSDVQFVIGQYDQARQGYEHALKFGNLARAERADVYRRLGRVAEYKAEYARALDDLQHGLAELAQPTGEIAARLYLAGGLVYLRQGEMARAREWCERGIALAEESQAKAESAQGYNLLGMIEQRQDQTDQALAHLQISTKIYHALGDLLGEARAWNNIAMANWRLGHWADAQKYFETAQQLYQQIGDTNGAAAVSNNLGEIYLVRGNLVAAGNAYHLAFENWERLGHRNGLALAMNNLSQVAIRERRWTDALDLLEQARALVEQLGAQSNLPELYRHLAQVYLGLNRLSDALEFAQRAHETAVNLGNRLEQGAAKRVWGQVLLTRGDPESAERALEESLAMLQSLNNRYEIGLTLAHQAHVKQIAGDASSAGELSERARAIFRELGARLDLENL